MITILNGKKYYIWDFCEKTSILKKKDNTTIVFNVYDECEEFKTLELPNQILIDKSDYYHWLFEDCKLNSCKIIMQKGQHLSFRIEVNFSYSNVIGTNNKTMLEREIKLNKLLCK